MGFFSSRKAEDNESYQVAIGVGGGVNEKSSVVQVIRSRFYGKKGKEREDPPPSFLGETSAAQVLSASQSPVAASPVPNTPTRSAGPSILRNHTERALPATPTLKTRTPPSSPTPSRIRNTPGTPGPSHSQHAKTISVDSTGTSVRKNTDTVTATLAQRLNELSVANSEGLLSDDEYRILRQNLFERFSTSAAVPIETPVVPASPQARPRRVGQTSERPSSRPLSNFQVERPLSIGSKTSAVNNVTDLFKRATGRRSNSKERSSDTASVWSSTSNTSFFKVPRLTRKTSNSSVHTNASRNQAESTPSSSKRPSGFERGQFDSLKSPASRSAGSIRKLAAPPSSFPGGRGAPPEVRTVNNNIYNVQDEDHLTSAKEIMEEIKNVEAEAKRLMDAFTGLEVTTLAKSQRGGRIRPPLRSADSGKNGSAETSWGLDSDGHSQRRFKSTDDTLSMRSGTSIGTAPSMAPSLARSVYSTKKVGRSKLQMNSSTATTNSKPGSLHRKNSSSSVTSERRLANVSNAPPVPALPNSISLGHHLKSASVSNISLARSMGHLTMNTVLEDENMSASGTIKSIRLDEDLENEMDDIRRRREEVSDRYDARLEYLRAKLKGAQLHEKLMRK